MLDSVRRNKGNFIYTFIVIAVVAVMAFYGIGQMAGSPSGGGAAAWVNGEPITKREFRQELEFRVERYRAMLGGQFDRNLLQAFQIPQRTLQELVEAKLLAQQAKQLDFRISDEELASFIRQLPYYQKDGKFDAELYTKLPNRGIEERQHRERLLVSRIQSYLAGRVQLTPEEIARSVALRESKANLTFAKINLEKMADEKKFSPGQIAEAKKAVSDQDIKAYYEAYPKEFADPARVQLSRIRIGVPFKATEEQVQKAKAKIEEIAKTVTAANFADKAKEHSDDEFAKKGGDSGWLNRGTLEKPLEDAIDELEVGAVSGPIKTSFGFFLIKVTEKQPEKQRSLEQVTASILEKLAQDKLEKEYVQTTRADWEKKLAAGQSIEPDLKRAGLTVEETGEFSLGQDFIPKIGDANEILDAVFQLTPSNPVSKKLFNHQGQYFYVRLKKFEPAKKDVPEKERENIASTVSTNLQTTLVTDWVEELKSAATVSTEIQFSETQTL